MKTLFDYFIRNVKDKPDHISLTDWDLKTEFTWSELNSISETIADRLRLMNRTDDYVLLCTPQNVYFPAALLACWKTQKIPIMIHEKYTESELKDIKTIIHSENVSVVLDSGYDLKIIEKFQKLFQKVIILKDIQGSSPSVAAVICEPDQLALGLFTSGTTALPKLCVFTHAALLSGAEIEQKNEQYQATDCIMNLRPHYTSAGLNTLWPSILLGIQNVISESVRLRPIPRFINEILKSKSLSHVILSPTYIISLFQNGPDSIFSPREVKLYFGGSSLPVTMLKALLQNHFLPSMRYGMTEISHIISKNNYELGRLEADLPHAGSVYSGFQARIINGHLAVQSSGLASFQIDRGQRISLCDSGWFQTEDHADIDLNGLLHLYGRQNQSVSINGFRFHVQQVENRVVEIDQVIDCRAVAVQSQLSESALVLFLITQDNADHNLIESRARKLVKENLSEYKWPSKYIFLKEWPVSQNGKINFLELKNQAQAAIK